MKYSYHPVHYDSHDEYTRYRVLALDQDTKRIIYEKIFMKEEDAKAYVDVMMRIPVTAREEDRRQYDKQLYLDMDW